MNTKSNEFIKYIGIDRPPKLITPYFKALTCNGQFSLLPNFPDMADLMTVTTTTTITSSEIVEVGDGYKAAICGVIKFSFQYATSDPKYSLFFGDHFLYFGDYISLPPTISHTMHLFPSVIVQDIFSHMLSPRTLYHNVMLLITVQLG
ncbi:MAG: hypothetical protein ACRCTE_13715 [Cellulosilyticaceae bacterium]